MKTFYDKNKVKYTLFSTNDGYGFNWIFLPGGPGCDSSYFYNLIKILDLPGNVWCIDFPGNGNHDIQKANFDNWLSIFIPTVRGFQNSIIVGHSFGGMLPLLFKECENLLKGLIILNSAPCLWLDAAATHAQKYQLPDLTSEMREFTDNPNQSTFNKALDACMPYYFPQETIEQGRELLSKIPFSFEPAV
jgi:pimeloyl-ACP methyl ester carboxylesterase